MLRVVLHALKQKAEEPEAAAEKPKTKVKAKA
jgi:hypothetical protein